MKTEFLKGLGLDDEIIKQVMAENGKDVTAEQKKAEKVEAERDNFKTQFETAQATLKGFEGVDVKDLQGELAKLKADLTAKDTEYQGKIADMEFNSRLDGLISSSGAKNAKAVKALLDLEVIKSSKNQDADLKTAIEACQKDNDYLFGKAEPINNPVAGITGTPPATDPLASVRAAMGLSTETK